MAQPNMLIAPERISIFQRVLHPSAEMKPVSELMPAAVKEITPMNAPTAMPILLMRVCIAKQMPSPLSPVFHSR